MYNDDELFAHRIAAPLRAPESTGPTFKARVMAAVHAESRGDEAYAATRPAHGTSPARTRHWWQRSITVHLTPVGGLALAAGIAGVAVLGGLALRRPLSQRLAVSGGTTTVTTPLPPSAVIRHDTTYIVRFMLMAPSASSVALVGDFNNWDRGSTRLVPTGQRGVWTVSVPLSAGQHEYAFIVDRTRWTADPHATLSVADDFGTESSIVTVGTRALSPTT